MAIKVGTDTVITDLKALNGITGTDDTTQTAINDAIVNVDNKLVIKDANGTAVKTIYGGSDA
jgi:hypothetical protein